MSSVMLLSCLGWTLAERDEVALKTALLVLKYALVVVVTRHRAPLTSTSILESLGRKRSPASMAFGIVRRVNCSAGQRGRSAG